MVSQPLLYGTAGILDFNLGKREYPWKNFEQVCQSLNAKYIIIYLNIFNIGFPSDFNTFIVQIH